MPVPVCENCGRGLSIPGSVTYVERYPGYVEPSEDGSIVIVDALLIDSSASCAGCGVDLPFGHADLTRGGFAGNLGEGERRRR
jgi:hypothetical protein